MFGTFLNTKHDAQTWSDMKGNLMAVPVCILSVDLRKLEVGDFGRFKFRIHLNSPEVQWCRRVIEEVHLEHFHAWTCMNSISIEWNSKVRESGRNQRHWKPWCRASCWLNSGGRSQTVCSWFPGNPNLKPRKTRRCAATCDKPFRNPWTAGRRSRYCHWPR